MWKKLIQSESTTVTRTPTYAELDIQASGRGTFRSARTEALRGPEQLNLDRATEVAEQYNANLKQGEKPMKVLNRATAAKDPALFISRHSVSTGETTVLRGGSFKGRSMTEEFAGEVTRGKTVVERVPARLSAATLEAEETAALEAAAKPKVGGGAAMAVLMVAQISLDAYEMSEDEKLPYRMAPYTFEDENGTYTFGPGLKFFVWPTYFKTYISGDLEGDMVEISASECEFLTNEAEALWGTVDENKEFVPGILVPYLPGPPGA
jgi:hypothetical protein